MKNTHADKLLNVPSTFSILDLQLSTEKMRCRVVCVIASWGWQSIMKLFGYLHLMGEIPRDHFPFNSLPPNTHVSKVLVRFQILSFIGAQKVDLIFGVRHNVLHIHLGMQ